MGSILTEERDDDSISFLPPIKVQNYASFPAEARLWAVPSATTCFPQPDPNPKKKNLKERDVCSLSGLTFETKEIPHTGSWLGCENT